MHVLALYSRPEDVCVRYRVEAYRPLLAQDGMDIEVETIPRGPWDRIRLFRRAALADVVILQRKLFSASSLYLLRHAARRLIFDFDDAIFLTDSYAPYPNTGHLRQGRFAATVQAADVVLAGNEFLHHEAARYAPRERIHTVPTLVNPELYPLARHQRRGPGVQLVWIGSSSTLTGIERQRPLFDNIACRVPGVEMKVICDRFPTFQTMPLRAVRWARATEARELAAADIGVSWLPNDRWSRGKCGLKVLQYMAAGLPVIANPVGVQGQMVRHGETGFLAATPEEWLTAVQTLAGDPGLRRRMGLAGRWVVERDFSLELGVDPWLHVLMPAALRVAV